MGHAVVHTLEHPCPKYTRLHVSARTSQGLDVRKCRIAQQLLLPFSSLVIHKVTKYFGRDTATYFRTAPPLDTHYPSLETRTYSPFIYNIHNIYHTSPRNHL
jgi:hypothetical protein